MIVFRSMTDSDIAAGLALCGAAGWNQLARDWKILLHLSPGDCRVATVNDKVIGTVTTLRYEKYFSWIGMVLVDPAYRGRGTGRQLLDEALQVLQHEETIKLDATQAGRELYLKLNFVDEYHLSRMTTIAPAKSPSVSAARPVHKKDMDTIANFDNQIFGADRQSLLEWMLTGAPELAFVLEDNKVIRGYCLGRHGHNFTQVGPVVAGNYEVAKELVAAALFNCIDQPVILDAMHFDPEWIGWLCSIGFAEQRSLIRMYRGSNRFPGLPEKQFAILGPEFG
ncbi:MAG: GNAT family N-acetyltransferase [Ginsengibacter sp.]